MYIAILEIELITETAFASTSKRKVINDVVKSLYEDTDYFASFYEQYYKEEMNVVKNTLNEGNQWKVGDYRIRIFCNKNR